MDVKIPGYLKPGDTIGLVSTASCIDEEPLDSAILLLQNRGYRVVLGQHAKAHHKQFAGTDLQRAADLQQMMDDSQVKAIFCSRGGYGTLRIMSMLRWDSFLENPKWIAGFSDVTVLHAALQKKRIASLHGVMTAHFMKQNIPTESFEKLMLVLEGGELEYQVDTNQLNRPGIMRGHVTGGNLSIIYSLRGTPFDIDVGGKILFIEDVSEYLYHLDRMMMNLKYGGKLENLAGLLVGGFSSMKDGNTPFGKTAEEIIIDAVSEYDYPVAFGFPAGHQLLNFPIKMGCMANVQVYERITFKQ